MPDNEYFKKDDVLSAIKKFHSFWSYEMTEDDRHVVYALLSLNRSPDYNAYGEPPDPDWYNVRNYVTLVMRALNFDQWSVLPEVIPIMYGFKDEKQRLELEKSIQKMPVHYRSHYSLAHGILTTAEIWDPATQPKAPLTLKECFQGASPPQVLEPVPQDLVAETPTTGSGAPV